MLPAWAWVGCRPDLTARITSICSIQLPWPFLRTADYEVGLYGKYASLSGADESAGIWSGNLQYLALAFPMANPVNQILEREKPDFSWGMSVALQPFTNIGYDIQTTEVLPQVDTTINSFQGTGGTYQLLWGNGFRYKDLSAGFTVGYLFGKLSNTRRVFFQDLGVAYQNDFEDDISIRGWTWNLGLQYQLWLRKAEEEPERGDMSITFGAYGHSTQGFKTNSSSLYTGVNGSYSDIDTILLETDLVGEGVLPSSYSFGAVFEAYQKLKLGIEGSITNWEEYENSAKPETLNNAWRFAFGGEYIPDITSYNNYGRRIRYRFGAFYGTDGRSFNADLTSYGITLGLGLPIILPRQQTSYVDLALEAGRFGSPDVLQETYVKLTLGFSLNDNSWFYKRKFD